MMKRFFALLSALILTTGILGGCNRHTAAYSPGDETKIQQALVLYGKAIQAIDGLTYSVKTVGSTAVKTPIYSASLNVRGCKQVKPGEVYFENVSAGKPATLFSINTSFARRAYYRAAADGRESVFRYGESEKNKNIQDDGTVLNWNTATDIDTQTFAEKFGRPITQFANYVINERTVTQSSQGATENSDGTVTLHFVLDTAAGAASESVSGYVKQVYTMSTMRCTDFYTLEVTFVISEDYRILQHTVTENYEVDSGIMGIKSNTTNNIIYAVTYYDTPDALTVTSF